MYGQSNKKSAFLPLSTSAAALPGAPSPKGSSCLCSPRAIEPHGSKKLSLTGKTLPSLAGLGRGDGHGGVGPHAARAPSRARGCPAVQGGWSWHRGCRSRPLPRPSRGLGAAGGLLWPHCTFPRGSWVPSFKALGVPVSPQLPLLAAARKKGKIPTNCSPCPSLHPLSGCCTFSLVFCNLMICSQEKISLQFTKTCLLI